MKAFEINCDGLIGPTHNFAGLSEGNLASMDHKGKTSHPRKAALQGLQKMKMLSDLGLKQAVLPPHERPDIQTLREIGFHGTDAQVLENRFYRLAADPATGGLTARLRTQRKAVRSDRAGIRSRGRPPTGRPSRGFWPSAPKRVRSSGAVTRRRWSSWEI